MSKGKFSRRQFLARAAVSAGGVAGAGALAGAACTSGGPQDQQHPHAAMAGAPAAKPGVADEYFVFFTTPQGHTVDAIAERIISSDELGPGAQEAGAVFYIDRALAGPYADLGEVYRAGLAAVDAYCEATYGATFLKLTADRQDAVLRAMEEGKATGFTVPTAQAFFTLLWIHTREGMFGDPAHGGNRNFIGWRLLRHPGVQWQHPSTAQWNGYETDLQIRAAGDWGFRR